MKSHVTRLAIVVLLVAGGIAPAGCSDADAARNTVTAEQPLRIVTTIRPIELIIRDLVEPSLGDLATVTVLMTPDVSPHGFEPTPSQMATLRSADLVIYNGLGLDDWAARDLPGSTRVIRFADVLGDDFEHHHHHHHHHDHDHHECDHGPIDEHFWLDVELVKAFAAMCAAEIGRYMSDSEGAHAALQQSLASFTVEVDAVDQAFADVLSEHAGRPIVTHHNVFNRLSDRYGLGEPIVLRPVEMLEPTPGDIRRAIEAIRNDGIASVFIEPQFSPAAAERIRDETGAKLVLVDPLGAEAASWSDMMRAMLEALEEGIRH